MHKVHESASFHLPVFYSIRTESLSMVGYGRKRISENPYSHIFYAFLNKHLVPLLKENHFVCMQPRMANAVSKKVVVMKCHPVCNWVFISDPLVKTYNKKLIKPYIMCRKIESGLKKFVISNNSQYTIIFS